jgi:hypothetical protein
MVTLPLPKREAVRMGDGTWQITVTPPAWSGFAEPQTLTLTPDQYDRFQAWLTDGTPIQDKLPDLTPGQREILMSGIGPEDWDNEFPDDAEFGDDDA